MSLPRSVLRAFRLSDARKDVDEELAFHTEATIAELMEEGLSRGEAERVARDRFGDERTYKADLERLARRRARRRRGADWLEARRDDLGHAVRSVIRSRGLAIGVALTLALGLGANATMFGITDRLLLRYPSHVEEPERLVRLYLERHIAWAGRDFTTSSLTFPDIQDLRAASTFGRVAAYYMEESTVGRGLAAHEVRAQLVSGELFGVLGTRPRQGRLLSPEDDRRDAAPAAVVSHPYANRRFGSDRNAIGETLEIGAVRYTIVGVTPSGFTGPELSPIDVWLPLMVAGFDGRPEVWVEHRNYWWLTGVARLAPGATPKGASLEATRLHRQARAELIARDEYDPEATFTAGSLLTARGPLASEETRVATWLAAVSLLVLIVACANVANLLLARGLRRRRETAVRLALGISRRRLLGQVLLESLLLSGLGAAGAGLIVVLGGDAFRTLFFPGVAWEAWLGQPRLWVFLFVATVAAGLAAGVVPAFEARSIVLSDSLTGASRSVTRATGGLRSTLVGLQAALSVLLIVGAGLFGRSLANVRGLDLGFDPEGILVATPEWEAGVLPANQRRDLAIRATDRIEALPGVELATASFATPFFGSIGHAVHIPGRDSIRTHPEGGPYIHVVQPGHFRLLGLRLLRGRPFAPSDRTGSRPVVIVNQTMARYVWPGTDPLGRCLKIGEPDAPCATVVGVVEDARRQSLFDEPSLQYYVPLSQETVTVSPEAILVRTSVPPGQAFGPIRTALLEAHPAVRFVKIQSLTDVIAPEARSWRLGTSVFTAFGVLALVIAAVGLYSVLAFSVAERRREIGVRATLGAAPRDLLSLVVRGGLRVTVLGTAVGLAVAVVAAPAVAPLLYGVSARDPVVLAVAASILVLASLVAATIPGWRAAKVDPAQSLRTD